MNRYIRILFGILFFSLTTYSVAQMTVSGTVTDASTGEALAGANVVVDGTSKGAAADASTSSARVAAAGFGNGIPCRSDPTSRRLRVA